MPTTYAHYRFGEDAIKTLPNDLKEIVLKNRDIFDIGVHGPDIFFYYEPLKKNEVVSFGNELHFKSARSFFEKCADVYQKHNDHKEMMLAYILGFLSHFTLDSVCHSYIDRKKEVSMISHNKVESQYDRYLMELDNLLPTKVNRSDYLHPNKEIAKVISYFFVFDEKVIYKAIKGQKMMLNLLYAPNNLKRNFLLTVMNLAKVNPEFKDLLIDKDEDELCKDANLRIDKLKKKALEIYPSLVSSFMSYLDDKVPLPSYFNHHFEYWDNYQEIPILDYEEEKNYEVRDLL